MTLPVSLNENFPVFKENFKSDAQTGDDKLQIIPTGILFPPKGGKETLGNRDSVLSYLRLGLRESDWFESNEKYIKSIFGQDSELILKLLGATSQRSTVQSNVTLMLKVLYRLQEKLPLFAGKVNFLPAMEHCIRQVLNGTLIRGRKIRNFVNALCGDEDAVVVDMWIARAYGLASRKYRGREYFMVSDRDYNWIEKEIKLLADREGITPRRTQSAIWYGIRKTLYTVRSRGTYEEVLRERTYFNLFWNMDKHYLISGKFEVFIK